MMKIYKFYLNYGRMGSLEGIFVADEEDVNRCLGKEIYFGEVLGKHSQVYCTLGEDNLQVLTSDEDFIKKFVEIMGYGTISGYNPLDYCEECFDSEEENEDEDD